MIMSGMGGKTFVLSVLGVAAGSLAILALSVIALDAIGAKDEGALATAAATQGNVVDVVPEITQLFSPGVVKEGLPPRGGPISKCHDRRQPSTDGFDLLPAPVDSVFSSCQLITYYGYPGLPGMGILGTAAPDQVAVDVLAMAEAYDAVNGDRTAAGAFHIVSAVAQASATADGSWLARIPDSLLQPWLEAAARHGLLVILDIQMGHSTVDVEVGLVLPYLSDPHVHLAIDPEWAMAPGEVPGSVIGGMDAAEINRAQELMSDYLLEKGLPRRMLVIHQFVPGMIRNKSELREYPNVDLVIDTDGFGTAPQKIANYERYIAAEEAQHGGFKLFFIQDFGLMTPAAVSSMEPQPDVVIYQ